jgi:hypothetical protein
VLLTFARLFTHTHSLDDDEPVPAVVVSDAAQAVHEPSDVAAL